MLLLLILPSMLFPQAEPDTVELAAEAGKSLTINFWVALGFSALMLVGSSIFFFFRGRLLEARKQARSQMTSRSIHMPVSLKNIIGGNKVAASVLAMVGSFFLGYGVFWLSGNNWQEFEIIGPWGIVAIVVTFGTAIFSLVKISKA